MIRFHWQCQHAPVAQLEAETHQHITETEFMLAVTYVFIAFLSSYNSMVVDKGHKDVHAAGCTKHRFW